MTLLEYVTSLQDQGLSDEEVFAKAQDWKKKNQTEEVKVDTVETPEVKEVKIEGVAETTDATVPPKTPDASESLESGSGQFQLDPITQYNLDIINQRAERKILQEARKNLEKFEEKTFDFNKIHENIFGKSIEESEKDKKKYRQDQINSILKKYEPGTPERAVAYYQLELAPDSTVDTKTYEAVVNYNENLKNLEKFKKGETKDAYNIQGLLPDIDASDIQKALSGVNRGENIPKNQENEKIQLTLDNLDNISKFMDKLDEDPDLKDFKSISELAEKSKLEIIGDTFLINMPLGLESTWEVSKGIVVNGLDRLSKKLGQTPDFLIESATAKDPNRVEFIDPQTNERILFSENPEKWKELKDRRLSGQEVASFWKGEDEAEIGRASDAYVISQFKKYQDLNNAKINVGEIVKEFDWKNPSKIKFSSGDELFGGIMTAIEGTVSSIIPAMVTGGASLIPQIGAPIYMDYNTAKANYLYPDDPNALAKLVANNQTEFKTPAVLTGLAASLEYIGFKGVAKHLIGKTGKLKPFVSLLYSQIGEGSTEWGQFGIEELNKNIAAGKTLGESMALAIEGMASKEGVENFLMGVIGAGSMGIPGTVRNTVSRALITETEVFNNATKLIQEISSLQQSRSEVNNKAYKEAVDLQIQEREQSLKDLLDNTTKLTSMMTKEEQDQIIDFLGQKKKNNKTLLDLNKSLAKGEITAQQYASAKGGVISSNKSITNKIDRVLADANKRLIEGEVAVVEDVAGKENVETFDTVDDFIKATGQDGKVDAFIDQNGKIFINKQRAAEVGAITAGSHELLHRILKSTFQGDSNTALKLVDGFRNILSEKERAAVDRRIEENYKDATAEVKAEEYLTAFSDAIGKGEITYKDNLKETFMRLAKPILDIFRPRGYAKLNFESGRDVYNFIKDYQKNIKKGKISERAQELQKLGEVDLGIIKKSMSNREVASNEVQNIYEEQGVSGALDIIEKFKPITSKIVEARSQAPNFDRQLLTDEIETGPRGILELIMEYKPESGVPLAAYINKFLPARAIEASRRVLGEEFTADVTEAKGVVAKEVAEIETKEKPLAKKPTETVEFSQAQVEKIGAKDKAEVETKITEATREAFKGQDIKTFGQTRNVPKTVADIYAGMFGLNPQTITDKTRNYQKTDAEGLTTAKQFLLKNAANDFARLPETKDGFGKGTFLPRNVMDALYTNGKLTGTLKDYMDLIRQKPTKPIYRDAVGQTIRGLLNLHIRNRMFEDLVTTTPERLRGGAKFSKTIKKSNIDLNINDKEFLQDYSTYERGGKLSKEKVDIVEDFIKKLAIQEADKGKSARQFMQTIKESNDPLIPKEGYYLLSDNKFKEDEKALKAFEKSANDLASQIPISNSVKQKQKNIVLGMFAGHYNIVGSERAKISGPFKTSIIENLNARPESVLSKETIERWNKFPWNDLNSSYASANYTALKKIYASDNLADQRKIAIDAFNSKQGKAALEFYDLWNTTMQEWLYSSELGSKAFEEKVNYILKLKKSNSAIGTTGERILAPPGYVYLPGKVIDGTIKFEHLKSSSEQSSESGILVINGKWSTEGKKSIKAYNGIFGMLSDFNSIDSQTGKVNESGVFRFAESLELAKNIYSVKSGFKTTLYDEIVNKVGEKAVKDFENTQLKISKTNNNSLPNTLESKTVKFYDNGKVVGDLSVFDDALNQARRPDAPIKKIRVFDFDDTLARSKSQVIVNETKPSEPQVIFLTGAAGSGKTTVAKNFGEDFIVIDKDIELATLMKEAGLPSDLNELTREQTWKWRELQSQASNNALNKIKELSKQGKNIIIDDTGSSEATISRLKRELGQEGYQTKMVLLDVPLEESIKRNRNRKERILTDTTVKNSFEALQGNKKRFKELFKDNFTIAKGGEVSSDLINELKGIKTYKITAAEFAEQGETLAAEGATFDFSEFSKVIEGKKGPLFSVAEKIAEARGTEDIFILTARPANAAGPIQEFMKANGIDLKLENIVGLGDGTAAAKGRWIASKAAEGYNDFYFADDAIKNVQAVKDVLSQVNVKSKVQQAKFSKTKSFDEIFNNIIEAKTGIESYKQYSAAKAKTVGASKGKFDFLIPPSAEDFTGLLYKMLGKGKVGDAQMAFFKTNLLDPYNRAELAISQAKVSAGRDYKELKKQFKNIPKTLEKETGISKFTYQHAIRTYIWDSQNIEVPGLSKRDQKRLTDFIKADPELQAFADQLVNIQKGKPYPNPNKDWVAGNITTDVIGGINKINRAEYLQEWQENVDIIFSEKNLNKLEAAFGAKYVEALKNSLSAMKSGSNRPLGGDRVSNQILDWINNSIGAIMFLNTRSAILQTISSVNFINWGDNNILKAGKAFANQKQYWSDFLTLMNSDYLLERRDGLKINVSESEIADAVENSKNKVTAAISFLLNKGFVLTRYADSFAIASGGATFYRNRVESLVKQGMDRKAAEEQAFNDFRAIAEENQQSSSPAKISQQQRSTIGRMVLAFGNTQLQYMRIQKRAAQDLINGRGDWKSNISKIVYYGAIQNILFNALQSGLNWALFDDDEEDDEKLARTLNGAIDSQLKGLGIAGAVTAGVKNALMTIADELDKKSPELENAIDDLENIIPAIGSKTRKLRSAARTLSWNRKEIKEKGFNLDNPAYLAGAQVISAVFNVPLDRAAMKMNNLRNVLNPATENWQKVALLGGWSTWDVDLPYWGLAEDKPVLTETEIRTQELFNLNKADQVKMLLDLGLTKKEIKALKLEDQRVQEIIKLENKKKNE